MSSKIRQKVIDAYLSRKDGFDWSGLMHYAQALLTSRDEVKNTMNFPEFDEAKARQALQEGKCYLQVANLRIDPRQFRDNCRKMFKLYIKNGLIHDPDQIKALEKINWEDLTDKTVSMAMVDPNDFFVRASMDLSTGEANDVFQLVLAGLLISVVRCYLNPTGEAMAKLFSSLDEKTSSDKPLTCPVCGSVASISAVKEYEEGKSSTRELFCACCGASWPFERIRCGLCGQTNPDKLNYVFADEDPGHRLHVCSMCNGALPTVFQDALKVPIDYDVEIIASSLVQTLYNQKLLQG